MKYAILILALLAIPALSCAAEQTNQSTPPPAITATQPAITATRPVSAPTTAPTTRPMADPAATKILNDLETAGEKYKTIKANIVFREVDRMLGESKQHTGWVAYQKSQGKSPTMFRITFETLKLGNGPVGKSKVDYAFDGKFFTVAKHGIKDMMRKQIAAEGEDIQPLKLGTGPFPIPFGQKAADVLERFEVTTRPATKTDPKNTRYLKLVPRRKYRKEISFKRAEMWIDAKTQLPVKLVSRDKKKMITTVTFNKLQTNVKIDAEKMFHIPRPAGWTYKIEGKD